MIFVKVFCKFNKCRRLLHVVDRAPSSEKEWGDYVYLYLCPQHGEGAGHGNVVKWQERQRRAGKRTDRVEFGRWIPWLELRPYVEEARRTGRTQEYRM